MAYMPPLMPAYTALGPQATTTAADPLWRYVNGLFLWNGNFNDNSTRNTIMAGAGNVAATAASSPGGYGSIALNGTSQYLSNATATVLEYSGNFTIEGYASLSGSLSGNAFLINTLNPGTLLGIGANSSNMATLQIGGSLVITGSVALPINGSYFYYAVVRSGGTITFYINGVSIGNYSYATAFSNAGLFFGQNGAGGGFWPGNMGVVRLSSYARYTAAFVPPTYFPTHG